MQPYVFNTYYAPGARDLGGWRVPTENLDRSQQWLQGRGNRVLHAQPYRQDPSQSTILFEDPTNNTIEFLSKHPRATLQENELDVDLRASSLDAMYQTRSRGTIDRLNRMPLEYQALMEQGHSPNIFNTLASSSLQQLEQSPDYQNASLTAFERLRKMAGSLEVPIEYASPEAYQDAYNDYYDVRGEQPKVNAFYDMRRGDTKMPVIVNKAAMSPSYKLARDFSAGLADRLLLEGDRSQHIEPFAYSYEHTPGGLDFRYAQPEHLFERPDYQTIHNSLTHNIARQAYPESQAWAKASYYDSLASNPSSYQKIIDQPLWSSQIRNMANYAGRLLM